MGKVRDGVMKNVPGFRPLYQQVYDVLLKEIADGVRKPGESLPSEQALARDFGVSQGTVRKALDVLTAEKLVDRRQGKGTFVAEHTQEIALFRFFRMGYPNGGAATPECGPDRVRVRQAHDRELADLDLEPGARVIEVKRVRLVDGEPAILEIVAISEALFAGLEAKDSLPNTLYSLYQLEYGISIGSVEEDIRADLALEEDSVALGVAVGSPLLNIDRVAFSVDGRRIERRTSRVRNDRLIYRTTVS